MSTIESMRSPGPGAPVKAVRGDAQLLVTAEDMERLRTMIEQHVEGPFADAAEALETELDRATIVPQHEIPKNVVTMRSRFLFEQDEGKQREGVLVYPGEADMARASISILAPVGIALLGLREGDSITWPVPGGKVASLKIVSVIYQPEAAGDLNL